MEMSNLHNFYMEIENTEYVTGIDSIDLFLGLT